MSSFKLPVHLGEITVTYLLLHPEERVAFLRLSLFTFLLFVQNQTKKIDSFLPLDEEGRYSTNDNKEIFPIHKDLGHMSMFKILALLLIHKLRGQTDSTVE